MDFYRKDTALLYTHSKGTKFRQNKIKENHLQTQINIDFGKEGKSYVDKKRIKGTRKGII